MSCSSILEEYDGVHFDFLIKLTPCDVARQMEPADDLGLDATQRRCRTLSHDLWACVSVSCGLSAGLYLSYTVTTRRCISDQLNWTALKVSLVGMASGGSTLLAAVPLLGGRSFLGGHLDIWPWHIPLNCRQVAEQRH